MSPALLALVLAPAAAPVVQEAGSTGWKLPPPEVVDLALAPPPPSVSYGPHGEWMLFAHRDALPDLEVVARPMLRLAGMRLDPDNASRFSTRFTREISVRRVDSDEPPRALALPEGARIAGWSWSHAPGVLAIRTTGDGAGRLFAVDLATGEDPVLLTDRLSTVLMGTSWNPDGRTLLAALVPEDRGAPPAAPVAPDGPNVESTSGEETPLRTYQDLLRSRYDADLFEHHATTELAVLSLDAPGVAAALPLPAAAWDSARVAPDGKRLLTTRIERPYSFLLPASGFPSRIEVHEWSAPDEPARTRTIADVPLQSGVPIGGVRLGPRNVDWAPAGWTSGDGATLVWAEALDGGDPDREVEHRDRWMVLELGPELEGEPRELCRTEHRASGLSFGARGVYLVREYDRDRRWIRTTRRDLVLRRAPLVVEDRSIRERYADPGRMATTEDEKGFRLIRSDDGWAYRTGRGATPEGDRPFLDRQHLGTGATERLWTAAEGRYETCEALLETSAERALAVAVRSESPTDPPNHHLVHVALPGSDGDVAERRALTRFEDPQPELRGVSKELVHYVRDDGVPLSATLYLPPGHEEGTRLPLLVWAYPREYNDVRTAGQVSGSPLRFTRVGGSSHLFLLTQGWAILDGATMPIIGDAETMNDTFVEQLVASAEAAVRFAVDRGVADADRVAIAGHSYGAFMTANLLAHSDLFAAGVARSGAYNRSLTPFGFQSERRTFWEAPETYFAVSPFMHADHIDEPLLLIHGEVDNNSGTFPMQSRRLFQAIKGLGGTARLVMLPGESHGYRARESVLHTLAETIEWLDEHVAQRASD